MLKRVCVFEEVPASVAAATAVATTAPSVIPTSSAATNATAPHVLPTIGQMGVATHLPTIHVPPTNLRQAEPASSAIIPVVGSSTLL